MENPGETAFRNLSPAQQDVWLAKAYAGGVSIGELAQWTGLSYTWMRRRLLRAGVDLRSRPSPKESPVPVEKLAEEYRAGASIRRIAETHGLYYKRVRELLLSQGVELRPQSGAKPGEG